MAINIYIWYSIVKILLQEKTFDGFKVEIFFQHANFSRFLLFKLLKIFPFLSQLRKFSFLFYASSSKGEVERYAKTKIKNVQKIKYILYHSYMH